MRIDQMGAWKTEDRRVALAVVAAHPVRRRRHRRGERGIPQGNPQAADVGIAYRKKGNPAMALIGRDGIFRVVKLTKGIEALCFPEKRDPKKSGPGRKSEIRNFRFL